MWRWIVEIACFHYSVEGTGDTVGALCYKPEGCVFNFRWGHWDFPLT